ncbi:uncharacterized protein LOC119246577 [Talpa occidentalis]|uniref:uncharacterized protein LOC119246577 n=1 Tax=Talpa occidentalis TaxID=50954 RepID=UPI00188DEFE0|nr:uncharacterized protein LOC119246577 [Talpa occidentalis]
MEKDVLDQMEDLTIQASDTYPDTTASLAALPAEANHTPWPDAAPDRVHAAWQGAGCAGSTGKKNIWKGRNRKENKNVYLPWPLTLQTRASSAAPVLGQNCVPGVLPFAHTGVNVGQNKEKLGNGEQEKTAILTLPWKEPADALLPAASLIRGPLGASLAASGVIKEGEKSSPAGRNINDKKVMVSPWPLTVQVWVTYTNPAQALTTLVESAPSANSGVNIEHKSKKPEGEEDQPSATPSQQSAQAGVPYSAATLGQDLLANSGENIGIPKRRHDRVTRKDLSPLTSPWPLTVQAWASLTSSDLVQTHVGGKSSATTMGVNVGQKYWPQLENSEEERGSSISGTPFSGTAIWKASLEGTLPQETWRRRPQWGDEERRQSSAQQGLEPVWGQRPAERYPRGQDIRECRAKNFTRQNFANSCHRGELCSQERMEALILTKAHTHISTSAVGMQSPDRERADRERAESQAVYKGKWGGS